jgi:hypothetical protein
MINHEGFRKFALSFQGAIESPHFGKTSFRVNNRIFATLDPLRNRACIKLSEVDQSIFCSIDDSLIYPVNNKWGKQGWTLIELTGIKKSLLIDALTKAFIEVSKKKSSGK